MQAIVVKYLGPTNCRGSRYKATAQAGSITLDADMRYGPEENAKLAATALREKFGWTDAKSRNYGKEWIHGFLPDGTHVFVNPGI